MITEYQLHERLLEILPSSNVKTALLDRVSFASDAGFYLLVPKAVVFPESEQQIIELFRLGEETGIPLVFRAGGTSLSGQSITDGILVEIGRNWKKITPHENGTLVEIQPGVIGAMVNARLKPFGRKIGPDPSSIASAMMGGILSNNSSGMCCGVRHNAYHTLHSIRFILPDGSVWDTSIPSEYSRFETEKYTLAQELLACRAEILANPKLHEKIRSKYKTKNTVGYSLNAFLDYEKPLDILAHLLIGAEGTLAFISKATLRTIPDYKYKATAFLFFDSIQHACATLPTLISMGVEALELMDYASLLSVRHVKGIPERIHHLPEGASGLLVEFQQESAEKLQQLVARAETYLSTLTLLEPVHFTTDPSKQALYWKVRKGMFPAVGAVRAQGTTVILEDVAFPVEYLGNAVTDLQKLFVSHGYANAIIFGHAKDGNLHFVITQKFENERDTLQYKNFIDEVVQLVVHRYGGALKAEHGTGRNMAPFVETEWGPEAYALMKRIKHALDPKKLLNPDVIINDDKEIHLKNIKKLPAIESEVDKCIECGACEPKCPSHELTMSPRRRIVARRRMEEYKNQGNTQALKVLEKDFTYALLDTCAVDGMCATDCPVDINTGDLVKRLRHQKHGKFATQLSLHFAKYFKWLERIAATGVKTLLVFRKIIGNKNLSQWSKTIHRRVGFFPVLPWQMAYGKTVRTISKHAAGYDAVYFTTCINRIMGGQAHTYSVSETLHTLAQKLGLKLFTPPSIEGKCCGQAFSSKGFTQAAALKANETVAALFEWSEQGKLPIIMDLSSCTYTMLQSKNLLDAENKKRLAQMRILDAIDWCAEYLLPKLPAERMKKNKVVLHPVCSLHKLGNLKTFHAIAAACAHEVIVPLHAGCCGTAGDRAFFYPELTESATASEADEIRTLSQADGYYSSARTCEMSLSEATGKNFQHIATLLLETLG